MTILERFEARDDDRRTWRRLPAQFPMQCRRLARLETDIHVETIDLSPGGVQMRCGGLITGDVVQCSVEGPDGSVGLKGLVVQMRPTTGHGAPYVHVAWTGLSPEVAERLARVLEAQEATAPDGGRSASPAD